MTNKSSYHNLIPIVGQGCARCLLSSILNLYEAQLNYRQRLSTDLETIFKLSFLVLYSKKKQVFKNKTGLSIPVNQIVSNRKEGSSHCLYQ